MYKEFPRVAFFSVLGWGGTERVVLNLLKELVKYPIKLDLVVPEIGEEFLHEVPPEVRVVELPNSASSRLKRVFPLVQYLRKERPAVLVSHLTQYNVISAIAKTLTGIPRRLVLVEHLGFASLEEPLKHDPRERIGLVKVLRHIFYGKADVVAAVSQKLAQEIQTDLNLKPGSVKTLYNPIVDETLFLKAQVPINHPWFEPAQPPVFLGAGRLIPQKDFLSLIQAFSILRKRGSSARLMILGEGDQRSELETLITYLNLESDVSLPGFVDNPCAYMSRATAFVLSSRFEGLPTVLIEALGCGCQVIATNCPYGPEEILKFGEYGKLVPIGDVKALADAMEQAISSPISPDLLRLRAQDFSIEKAVLEYLRVMDLNF